MARCPAGHDSASADYCDVCGEVIAAGAAEPAPPSSASSSAPASGAGTPCPDCGTPGTDRFCEVCGYDFATGGGAPTGNAPDPDSGPAPGPAPDPGPDPGPGPVRTAAWIAVVNADRDYYESIVAAEGPDAALPFPPYCPERRIPLAGPQVRIGRRSSAGTGIPEIDLREPPEDPGVSHTHAVLLARPDGTWSLVDPGSTNRTCVNGDLRPIPLNVEVPVGDGDRIHVGAWTTIELQRSEAP
ncbi:FHA domain-containing protein [Actinomadura parmotrematis]|uniref:FHA domain-containing protein n=1 Tax=Actinomadura parmotrematis TaxID=2864039 RepID=A0ABS7G0S8_9ACTN|nr:FHA domain-containing protein [Actinomadura parmotrematis]MBW8485995.1 FHA domain-containing protein [Actinomadura parmotrematis]